MSDYYDSDDDDVFRAKSVRGRATSGSRYGAWEQSELERHMFSWTLHDVLNKNLLKKKVSICLFSIPFYLCQFIKQKRNAQASFYSD
jgi:senataxin